MPSLTYDFGMVTNRGPFGLSPCPPEEKLLARLRLSAQKTRGDQLQNQRSTIRRQCGALSFAISHQVQNVRVFEPLQSAPTFHFLSTIILHSQCENRTWLQNPICALECKRRDFSRETGTQSFVSTRDFFPSRVLQSRVVCLLLSASGGSLRSSSDMSSSF